MWRHSVQARQLIILYMCCTKVCACACQYVSNQHNNETVSVHNLAFGGLRNTSGVKVPWNP